jgi:hypothetical protein
MSYTKDQKQVAAEVAKWQLQIPTGYEAIAIDVSGRMPDGVVVRHKTTGVLMLAVGHLLRSFDPRLLGLDKADGDDTIVIRALTGTKARWVRQSQRDGLKLSDWVIKQVDASTSRDAHE